MNIIYVLIYRFLCGLSYFLFWMSKKVEWLAWTFRKSQKIDLSKISISRRRKGKVF